MDILQQFLAYAGDFEKTLADDNVGRVCGAASQMTPSTK